MATSKNNETYLLTQTLINSNAKTDVNSLSQSFNMNSSTKENDNIFTIKSPRFI